MLKEIFKPVLAFGLVASLLALPACVAEVPEEDTDEATALSVVEASSQEEPSDDSAGRCCNWHCEDGGVHREIIAAKDCRAHAIDWCHARGTVWGERGESWWGACY